MRVCVQDSEDDEIAASSRNPAPSNEDDDDVNMPDAQQQAQADGNPCSPHPPTPPTPPLPAEDQAEPKPRARARSATPPTPPLPSDDQAEPSEEPEKQEVCSALVFIFFQHITCHSHLVQADGRGSAEQQR